MGRGSAGLTALATMLSVGLLCSAQAFGSFWSEPVVISPPDEYAETPQVAVNARGDEAVVWEKGGAWESQVEISTRPAGGTQSPTITLSDAPGHNDVPSVAVSPDGRVLVAWTTEGGSRYRIWEEVVVSWGKVGDSSFTAPKAISEQEGGSGNLAPQVGLSDSGEALALWRGLDQQMHYATSAPSSEAFSSPRTIANPSPQNDLLNTVVAIAPSGAAVAAWTDRDTIYAAVRDAGGVFGAAQTVQAQHPCIGEEIHAAINNAGTAVLDWTEDWRELHEHERECEIGETPTILRSSYRPSGEAFQPPVTASEMQGGARPGGVAVSPSGNVTVGAKGILINPPETDYRDFALTRLPDGTYGDPRAITHQEELYEPVELAYDQAGSLYGVGETREEEPELFRSGVFANTAAPGGTFAPESVWVQPIARGKDGTPSLATGQEGHPMLAWQAAAGGASRIELSQLEPGEPPGGGEPPAPEPPPGSPMNTTQTSPGTESHGSLSGIEQASAVGGVFASRASAAPGPSPRRPLIVTGRAMRATEVLVRLVDMHHHIARAVRARLQHGRFTATIAVTTIPRGRYKLQIVRRHGRTQRTEVRTVSIP
jgi:hypothetical protein